MRRYAKSTLDALLRKEYEYGTDAPLSGKEALDALLRKEYGTPRIRGGPGDPWKARLELALKRVPRHDWGTY